MRDTTIPDPPGFTALSKADQVQYLQALWDRIAKKPGEIPAPESHLDLAGERLAEYRRDPAHAHSAYEVFDRVGNKQR